MTTDKKLKHTTDDHKFCVIMQQIAEPMRMGRFFAKAENTPAVAVSVREFDSWIEAITFLRDLVINHYRGLPDDRKNDWEGVMVSDRALQYLNEIVTHGRLTIGTARSRPGFKAIAMARIEKRLRRYDLDTPRGPFNYIDAPALDDMLTDAFMLSDDEIAEMNIGMPTIIDGQEFFLREVPARATDFMWDLQLFDE